MEQVNLNEKEMDGNVHGGGKHEKLISNVSKRSEKTETMLTQRKGLSKEVMDPALIRKVYRSDLG
jgi:hypothetical protein